MSGYEAQLMAAGLLTLGLAVGNLAAACIEGYG